MKEQSVRSKIVTRRTYNRPLDDEGKTFETWAQTVNRVISHQRWLWERALGSELTPSQETELEMLKQLILERKVCPSGRTLWLGGTETGQTKESSNFNCAFLRVQTVYDCVDSLWLLLNGCGVGFMPQIGTLNGFSEFIPSIEFKREERAPSFRGRETNKETIENGVWTLSIGDSAEAWCKAIGKLLARKVRVDKLIIDTTEIRGPGERLKGYGWLCSGDTPLVKALEGIIDLLNRRAGSLLSRIDILDLVNWFGTILSTRRSAEICLFSVDEPEWREFATAKHLYWEGNIQRGQSNNSLLFNHKPTRGELKEVFDLMERAGGSEPGFINGEAARTRAPWFYGVNPCAEILLSDKSFCVKGDTPLITRGSLANIEDVIGMEIEIWNGQEWSSVIPRVTGTEQEMLRVSFGDGSYLDCTPDHRFSVKDRFQKEYREVQAKYLLMGATYVFHTEPFEIVYEDGYSEPLAYTYGVAYGDGYSNKLTLYTQDKIDLPVVGKRQKSTYRQNPEVPQQTVDLPFSLEGFSIKDVFLWDKQSILSFVAGLADSDGSNTSSGGIRIYQSDEHFIRQLQLLLTKVGIRSSVNLMAEAGKSSNFIRRKASWYVQICDCSSLPCHRLYTSRGHKAAHKGKHQTIVSVEPLDGLHTSYCFDEPKRHMGVFNNTLTYQCNLTEVDVGKFRGNSSGLAQALKLIARANYRQTCVNLMDGILQEAWHLNNDFLRLCGVGLTGIAKRPDLGPYDYSAMQRITTSAAYSMAAELGSPLPKNITTVKPSGTLSKIMDTTEGVHKPLGRYIINNIGFSKHDPLVLALRQAGYRVIDHPTDPEAVLAALPVKHEGVEFDVVNGLEVNNESAVKQLERYKLLQTYWTQQNTSVTISYSLGEVPQIIDWLLANWDSYVGVSFLYRADPTKRAKDLGYPYLPQEVVTKEEYEDYVKTLGEVDIDGCNSLEEIQTVECEGGACPIK